MSTEPNTEVVDELVAPVIEPIETPPVDAPVLEDDEVEPQPTPHPLKPGGMRFEQVYAQKEQTKRALAEERERRIRAEAQLEMLQVAHANTQVEKEYSWDELEAMVAAGQITRADANRHREEVVTKQVTSKIKKDFQTEIEVQNRASVLGKTVYDYVQAVPDLTSPETPIRQRVDREFDWLVAVQGKSADSLSPVDRKALEVTALRNVLGPVETLSKRLATPNAEPHQGSIGGTPPARRPNPDQALLDKLTPREIEHYHKMFKAGRYPNKWKDVVAELKYVPGTKVKK